MSSVAKRVILYSLASEVADTAGILCTKSLVSSPVTLTNKGLAHQVPLSLRESSCSAPAFFVSP